MSRLLLFIFVVVCSVIATPSSQASCEEWFRDLSIKPGTKDCEMKCASSMVDLGTFECPMHCRKLCKEPPKACTLSPFWEKVLSRSVLKLKTGGAGEEEQVVKSLSRLPKLLRPNKLSKIKREKRAFWSPHNPASYVEGTILLFDPAFRTEQDLDRILFHEMVHALLEDEWTQYFSEFKRIAGWKLRDGKFVRSGSYIESDSEGDPNEDFANVLEYYVFDRKRLDQVSPATAKWVTQRLGNQLKIERGCM